MIRKVIFCFAILALSIGFTGCKDKNIDSTTTEQNTVSPDVDNIKNIYYSISSDESNGEFEHSDELLEKLKSFNKDLKMNFDTIDLHTQFLTHDGEYFGDSKFSANGLVNEDTIVGIQTKLQTFIVGEKLYKHLDGIISKGSNFSKDDFKVTSGEQTINILLGSEYEGIYDIGDKLTLSMHDKSLNLKVIGFLKPEAYIKLNYIEPEEEIVIGTEDIDIDKSIVLPFYDIEYTPTDEKDYFYQMIYYLQKNDLYIKVEEPSNIDREKYQNKVNEIATKNNLTYKVYPAYIKFSGFYE